MKLYVSHVCLGLNIPLENFSLVWKCRHYRWSASKSDICAALMAIKKWGLISAPQLYCDKGPPFKWSSLRTRDTRTFCRAFGSWALTSCCLTTWFYNLRLSGPGFVHITFRMRGNILTDYVTAQCITWNHAIIIVMLRIKGRRDAEQFHKNAALLAHWAT